MRKSILLVSLLLMSIGLAKNAYAGGWYLFDINNEFRGICNSEPTAQWLEEMGGLIAVYAEEDIPQDEVEYRGGKAVRHIKTTSEIIAESAQKDSEAEYKVIYKRMKKIAIDQLETEGHEFEYDHLEE